MSSGFRISAKLTLPIEAATWVFAFLAKRGAGKTYDAADLAEEMIKAGVPIVVIDGMGTWWGLRVGPDGTGPGLPVVVFGGDHQDLPLLPEKSKDIARAIVQTNISAVIDVSALSRLVSRRIITEFLNELYQINRVRRSVFIEETDLWAPQKPLGEEAVCLGAVDNFVRRGGNRNLGCVMITQRSAVLNKNILTQSDCLVVLRTLAPQDKKAIQAWVEEATDKERKELNEWYDSLKELKNGEAWVWHPEKPVIYERVMFRKRETFHATREFIVSPKAAEIKLMDWQGLQEFVEQFKPKLSPAAKPVLTVKPGQLTRAAERVDQKVQQISHVTSTGTTAQIRRFVNSPAVPEPPIEQPVPIVQQTLPNLVLEKLRPTILVPAEPSTALGRTLVVLMNHQGRQDQWTIKKVRGLLKAHAWPEDSAEEAIDELLRAEILHKQSNKMLRFYPERVQVREVAATMEVQ